MTSLTLRISEELYNRIKVILSIHKLSMSEFCKRSMKQYCSKRIKPVVEHELLNDTTYKGKVVKVLDWNFDITGKELIYSSSPL